MAPGSPSSSAPPTRGRPDEAGAGPAPADGEPDLRPVGERHFAGVAEASDAFFEARADTISEACRDMAKRFHRDGRLLVFAPDGPVRSDAYHVSVEFVHPVLVGKRALPAATLEGDPAERVRTVGRPLDIALGITSDGEDEAVAGGLAAARDAGLLTVGLAGAGGGRIPGLELDHSFVIPSDNPFVVQEVQETLYHVLWELVHVFFDHEGLL